MKPSIDHRWRAALTAVVALLGSGFLMVGGEAVPAAPLAAPAGSSSLCPALPQPLTLAAG